jgi:hypothetical protein
MAGNNKADASAGTDLKQNDENRDLGDQRLLVKSGQIDRYWLFMTSPAPECTCGCFEKKFGVA